MQLIPQLQYAFVQDALEMEHIIIQMEKELQGWSTYQIRRNLKLDKEKDLPINWKKNIQYYLNSFQNRQRNTKLNRIDNLRKILENNEQVCRGFQDIAVQLQKQKQTLFEIIEQDESYNKLLTDIIISNLKNQIPR